MLFLLSLPYSGHIFMLCLTHDFQNLQIRLELTVFRKIKIFSGLPHSYFIFCDVSKSFILRVFYITGSKEYFAYSQNENLRILVIYTNLKSQKIIIS